MHKGAQDSEIGLLHTLFYYPTCLFVPKIHVDAVIRHMNEILGFLSPTYFSFSQPELERPPLISIYHHLLFAAMCQDLKVGLIIADLRCFTVCCDLQNAPKVLRFVPLMLILDSKVVYSHRTAQHCS